MPRPPALRTLLAVALVAAAGIALGQDFANVPATEPSITDWMLDPVTPIAHEVRSYTLFLVAMTLPYLLLPQVLLLYCIFKFGKKPGMRPATFHENVRLEVVWTIVPALTLVLLAIPAYGLIKKIENMPEADVNIQVIGHQFYWEYRYPDYNDIRISEEPLVIPVNKTVVADMTSVDVNHAWWVPAFGIKMDTVPGRTTQVWFNVEREGWFKGQCAELCGTLHSKMLIDVHVVSQEEFDAWIAKKQAEFAPADEAEETAPEPSAGDADEGAVAQEQSAS
ncbi:MAG: cytochrome c oxidase subunit [Candidatus Sumerlaeota bacterium]|nr:cytochrome c oxidase subunit [Candidatus Sumerlaeota bacterium]